MRGLSRVNAASSRLLASSLLRNPHILPKREQQWAQTKQRHESRGRPAKEGINGYLISGRHLDFLAIEVDLHEYGIQQCI